eukprot:2315228-Prymnesium_polylepis.1
MYNRKDLSPAAFHMNSCILPVSCSYPLLARGEGRYAPLPPPPPARGERTTPPLARVEGPLRGAYILRAHA